MKFSKSVFGKSLKDLNYEDIKQHFQNPQQLDREDVQLEYKSIKKGGPEYDGVVEAICAFLNTDGGLLIWGAPSKNDSTELTPFTWKTDRDSLISKLSMAISEVPKDIRLEIIKNSEGQGVVVIEVDTSTYAPHQVKSTGRYLMRLQGQSVPAPHNFVTALMMRMKTPQIECYLRVEQLWYDEKKQELELTLTLVFMNRTAFQTEEELLVLIGHPKIGRYVENGVELVKSLDKTIKYIHHGHPELQLVNSIFRLSEITETPEFTIPISFRGRYSKPKCSFYTFTINLIDAINYNKEGYKRIITKREENKLMSELFWFNEDKNGEEDFIRRFVNGEMNVYAD